MIERIIRASASRPFVVVTLVLLGAVIGSAGLLDLRRDVFPDLSAPVFNVIVQNAAMGPEELEVGIAVPLETALAGVPGARRVRSVSQLGVAQVTIEFEPDVDATRARQWVAERVQQVTTSLPPGTEPPLLSSLTGRLNEVLELTLEARAGSVDLMTLRDLAEFDVKNRLLAVPGVAAVERLGGHLRQFHVQIDPDRMVARGITLDDVLHALDGANVNGSGGVVVQGPMEWSVRAVGRVDGVADLGAVVVALRGATPVLLADVADVREAPALRRGLAHRLNGEIVSCRVVKQFGADTVQVADDVRAALAEVERGLPDGMTLRIAYDQSALVRASLGGVGRAVLVGAVFVVIVLFALLGHLRAALLVTLTLPLSVALAGLLLHRLQVGLNTMTLGGLAIAVGLLVDASIIVVENVLHRGRGVAAGARWRGAAVDAAVEVGRPIAFATLIVIAVFLPLFAMSGIEGRMYGPLAAAVMASMAAALVLALTLTPVASGWLLSPAKRNRARAADSEGDDEGDDDGDDDGDDVSFIRWLKRGYVPALSWCMQHAGLVRVGSLAITVPALLLAARLGADLMPELDEGALLIQTVLPAEASLDQVDRLNHRVEDVLRSFPEVEDVVRRTGRSERTEDPMPHTISDVLVVLRPERARSIDELTDDMRARVANVPGVTALFTTPLGMRIDEGLGGTPADVSVRIFGPDLDELARLGERVRQIAAGVRGLADLRVEQATGLPQLRIVVDRPALARVGLTPGDVIRAVRIGMVGEDVGEVWQGQRRFDLVVRLQDDHRSDPAAIRSILIDGHDGTRVPLGQVARLEQVFAPGAIRREAGSRRLAVEASVEGRDLASTAAELRAALARDLSLPTGYFVDVGGRVEQQARATRTLVVAIVVAVVAVLLLLVLALGSLLETLVILATLPDAFVGGIVALWLAGGTWNVSSLVGLIGLLGIAVQNGLVLVTQTRALVAAGHPFERALREACVGRVRPKVMTAMTAILGLLPLLVLRLHGTEIERPLAIVMIGGLTTSTLFTLLALPTFYAWVHAQRERWRLRARTTPPTSTAAEAEG
jgi:cobalt-zinc-cadmium resistance protein CzcA